MAKIAVFDSGIGSLSIIGVIQDITKAEIIYFADQANFPYGTKSRKELGDIIDRTIQGLQDKFAPDVIVMASNTPSLILGEINGIIGVHPPIYEVATYSKTNNIAILGTKIAVNSNELDSYIISQNIPRDTIIHKIDSSELVELVETGLFLTDKNACKDKIRHTLKSIFEKNHIDAATLSSTHLPFLAPLLKSEFPSVIFFDPAESVATKIVKRIANMTGDDTGHSTRHHAGNSTRHHTGHDTEYIIHAYTSGDVEKFQQDLTRMGVRCSVNSLTF